LRKVLQNLNLLCDEAENGQVAVDFHRQGKTYDLVLMDKEMPVMDGHQATRQLRMMGVKTPIIALTGNAMQSDRELFFEAGVNDFQTKVSHIFWKLNPVTLFWIFEGSVTFIRLAGVGGTLCWCETCLAQGCDKPFFVFFE
jgi:PleD family two-component response regulator